MTNKSPGQKKHHSSRLTISTVTSWLCMPTVVYMHLCHYVIPNFAIMGFTLGQLLFCLWSQNHWLFCLAASVDYFKVWWCKLWSKSFLQWTRRCEYKSSALSKLMFVQRLVRVQCVEASSWVRVLCLPTTMLVLQSKRSLMLDYSYGLDLKEAWMFLWTVQVAAAFCWSAAKFREK